MLSSMALWGLKKFDAEAEARAQDAAKEAILKQYEERMKQKKGGKDDNDDMFSSKMIFSLINNAQIEIKNIHLRFEEREHPQQPAFAAGITLERLAAYSVNDQGHRCDHSPSSTTATKYTILKGLGLYVDTQLHDRKLLLNAPGNDRRAAMYRSIVEKHQFVLDPLSFDGHLRISKKIKEEDGTTPPQFDFKSQIPVIGLALRRLQYFSLLRASDSLTILTKRHTYRDIRPKDHVRGHAKQWWKFAYEASVRDWRASRKVWTWQYMAARRKQRQEYIALYQRVVREGSDKQTPTSRALGQLERTLAIDDVLLYRKIARSRLPKEKKQAGFFGSFTSFFGSSSPQEEEAPDESAIRKEFQQMLESETDYELATSVEYEATRVQATLQKFRLSLLDDTKDKEAVLLALNLTGLSAIFAQRPAAEAIAVHTHLKSFDIQACRNEKGQLYPLLYKPTKQGESTTAQNLFTLAYETNPIRKTDVKIANSLRASLQPLAIDVQPHFLQESLNFFAPPSDIDTRELIALATSGLLEAHEQTLAGLEYAVSTSSNFEIDVQAVAPRIRIGVDDERFDMLVLDLGSLQIKSNLKTIADATKLSFEELSEAVYDDYGAKLTGVQLAVLDGTTAWDTGFLQEKAQHGMCLLRPINIDAVLSRCLRTQDTRLPELKLSAKLPELSLDLVDQQLVGALRMTTRFIDEAGLAQEAAPPDEAYWDNTGPSSRQALDADKYRAALLDEDEDQDQDEDVAADQEDDFQDASDKLDSSGTPHCNACSLVMCVPTVISLGLFTSCSRHSSLEGGAKPIIQAKRRAMARIQKLAGSFSIDRVSVNIHHTAKSKSQDTEADSSCTSDGVRQLLGFDIHRIHAHLGMRTFDMRVKLSIAGMAMISYAGVERGQDPYYLLYTQAETFGGQEEPSPETIAQWVANASNEHDFISVELAMSPMTNPLFEKDFDSCEMDIQLRITHVTLDIAQEGLMDFAQAAFPALQQIGKDITLITQQQQKRQALQVTVPEYADTTPTLSVEATNARTNSLTYKPNHKFLRLHAKLEGVDVALVSERKRLVMFDLRGVRADVTQTNEEMLVKASLKSILMEDFSVANSMYPNIITMEEQKELLSLHYQTFSQPEKHDGYGADIKCHLGTIQVVAMVELMNSLNTFIKPFMKLSFDAERVAATWSAEQDATVATAPVAPAANAAAPSGPFKFKVALQLAAPEIIVPFQATRKECFVLKLGKIHVDSSCPIHRLSNGTFEYQAFWVELQGLQMIRTEARPHHRSLEHPTRPPPISTNDGNPIMVMTDVHLQALLQLTRDNLDRASDDDEANTTASALREDADARSSQSTATSTESVAESVKDILGFALMSKHRDETVSNAFDSILGFEVDRLEIRFGTSDYRSVIELTNNVLSAEVLQVALEEADSDSLSVLSEDDVQSIGDISASGTSEGSSDIAAADTLTTSRYDARLNGPQPSTVFAFARLGEIRATLYHEPSRDNLTDVHADKYKLASLSVSEIQAVYSTSNEDEVEMSADLSLDAILLRDCREVPKAHNFDRVFQSGIVDEDGKNLIPERAAKMQGEDDAVAEERDPCLQFKVEADRRTVKLCGTQDVDFTDTVWLEQLRQLGTLVHFYRQEAAPIGQNVAVAEFDSAETAADVVDKLLDSEIAGLFRVELGPATRSNMDAKFTGFDVILAPDFLADVLSFVLDPFADDKGDDVAAASQKETQHASAGMQVASAGALVRDMCAVETEYQQFPTMFDMLFLRARIEHPAVMLIEDASKDDTRCLVLDFVLKADYHQNTDVTTAFAAIEGLTVISKVWNSPATQLEVLSPVDVTAQYRQGLDSVKASLMVGELGINLAYADIQLATRLAASISKPFESVNTEVDAGAERTTLPVGSFPAPSWTQAPFAVDFKRHLPKRSAVAQGTSATLDELYQVDVPFVDITLINTMHERRTPIFVFSTAVTGTIRNPSTRMSGSINLSLAAAVLEPKHTAWEPFLLSCEERDEGPRPYELTARIKADESPFIEGDKFVVVKESGHDKIKMANGFRGGRAAHMTEQRENTFWCAHTSRHSRGWVVFDMGKTVKLEAFLFTSMGLADHAPLESELRVADKLDGNWRMVSRFSSHLQETEFASPKFTATGRFWKWSVTRCHGSNKNAFIRAVRFQEHTGGLSLVFEAEDRLDATITSNAVDRLLKISTEWMRDLNRVWEEEDKVVTKMGKDIGLYELENATGRPLAFNPSSVFDKHQARKNQVAHGDVRIFAISDMPTQPHIDDVKQMTHTRLVNASSRPIRDLVVLRVDKKEHAPPGYKVIKRDLNEGTGGYKFYLAYTTEGDQPPITDIHVHHAGKLHCSSAKDGCFELPPAGHTRIDVNINENDGIKRGRRTYISFSREPGVPITAITVAYMGGTLKEAVPSGFRLIPKNLSQGRKKGENPYLCIKYAAAEDLLNQPLVADREPRPITDLHIVGLARATDTKLPAPDRAIQNWDSEYDGKQVNMNEKSGGMATYLMYARDSTRAPITALAITVHPQPPGHGWETLPQNLNEGNKAQALYLHYQREPGAHPVVEMKYTSEREIPEGFKVLTPELNLGLNFKPALYLCYRTAPRLPKSFRLDNEQAVLRGNEDLTLEEKLEQEHAESPDDESSQRSGPRTLLKAIECLAARRAIPNVSVEVEGWKPLENIPVDRTGESTYLMEDIEGNLARVVIHVFVEGEVKRIVIRSPLQIVNRFPFPVEVRCNPYLYPDGEMKLLHPHEAYSPPLGALDASSGRSQIVPLYRFWSPQRERHVYSANPTEVVRMDSSFVAEAVLGYIFTVQLDDTIPLYGSRINSYSTRFKCFTNRQASEKQASDGSSKKKEKLPTHEELLASGHQVLGYVHPHPTPETVALWSFASKSLDDNLVTTERDEVTHKFSELSHFFSKYHGYAHERLEAHVLRHEGDVRVRPAMQNIEWSVEQRQLHQSVVPPEKILVCPRLGDVATIDKRAGQFACYLDSHNGELSTAYELRAPVSLRNMLPCPLALAVVKQKEDVPKHYVGLRSGQKQSQPRLDASFRLTSRVFPGPCTRGCAIAIAILQLATERKFVVRLSFAASSSRDVLLEDSKDLPIPPELWSRACTIDLDKQNKQDVADLFATVHWVDPMTHKTNLLKLGLKVERRHGSHGPVCLTAFCPFQFIDRTSLTLSASTEDADNTGILPLGSPVDLRANTFADRMKEQIVLLSPMNNADKTFFVTDQGLESETFSLISAPSNFVIKLFRPGRDKSGHPDAQLAIHWEFGDRMNLSKRFIIESMLTFENTTPMPIQVAMVQHPAEAPGKDFLEVQPFDQRVLNLAIHKQLWKIRVPGCEAWSAAFSATQHLDSLNTTYTLKLPTESFVAVDANCVEHMLRHIVSFSVATHRPPMRIENYSSHVIEFHQGCDATESKKYVLRAHEGMKYALDEPAPFRQKDAKRDKLVLAQPELVFSAKHTRGKAEPVAVRVIGDQTKCLTFVDEQGRDQTIFVCAVAEAEGATVCYVLADTVAEMRALFGLTGDVDADANSEQLNFDLTLDVAGFGASFIADMAGSAPKEFAYLSVLDIRGTLIDTTEYFKVAASIRRLQIDYQAPDAEYPVPLYAEQEMLAEDDPQRQDVITASYVLRRGDIGVGRSQDFVEHLGVRVLPLVVRADGRFAADAMAFASIAELLPASSEPSAPEPALPMLWRDVQFNPIQAAITVTDMDPVLDQLPMFLRSLGVSLVNLSNVTFKLNSIQLQELFVTMDQLTAKIGQEYKRQAIRFALTQGVIRGIGGLEMFGDPLGALSSVAGGFSSLFYEPYKGLVKGPGEFGKGVGVGVTKLTTGVVGGITGIGSKVTGAAGSGLATLTMDDKYESDRRRDMQQKPTNVGSGVATGLKRFGKGFYSGLTGVVTTPVREGKEKGFVGALAGTGKGLVGLVSKPVGGAVDMVSSTFAGIDGQVRGEKAVTRLRQPRVLRYDGHVTPYSPHSALGLHMLTSVDVLHKGYGQYQYVGHTQEDVSSDEPIRNASAIGRLSSSRSRDEIALRFIFVLDERIVLMRQTKNRFDIDKVVDARKIAGYMDKGDDGLQVIMSDNSATLLPMREVRVKQELVVLLDYLLQLHRRIPATVWEYQRKYGAAWRAKMLAIDQARCWTLVDNSAGYDLQEMVKPPEGYEWTSDWSLIETKSSDSQGGWSYTRNFRSPFSDEESDRAAVRRRMWSRRAQLVDEQSEA
ncbi:uncharacterized protein MONBRDRAFT_10331 [Monosiga brevicollis MX1]|uniref:MABP domain-containing protein n=1 Tax=Monosiga brevicollis TaxID=81824 RepID=A9V5X0_MONBE|nr:uncharacterized protein MONBRDRAFT_10331 [Monosiga brevicollis MX1]EDQ87121.1 predicted protein [Monosiga brevicollis MX1]|eukprot:XP_001748064.1 hypothetical protein [Monosiga brevicollis MX1]